MNRAERRAHKRHRAHKRPPTPQEWLAAVLADPNLDHETKLYAAHAAATARRAPDGHWVVEVGDADG